VLTEALETDNSLVSNSGAALLIIAVWVVVAARGGLGCWTGARSCSRPYGQPRWCSKHSWTGSTMTGCVAGQHRGSGPSSRRQPPGRHRGTGADAGASHAGRGQSVPGAWNRSTRRRWPSSGVSGSGPPGGPAWRNCVGSMSPSWWRWTGRVGSGPGGMVRMARCRWSCTRPMWLPRRSTIWLRSPGCCRPMRRSLRRFSLILAAELGSIYVDPDGRHDRVRCSARHP
jgi:hypothetical protein